MTRTKESTLLLVKRVQANENGAFSELEGVAKPLLVSLSNRFSNYHSKFEFDDFYSIGLMSLYQASMSFKNGNPSFLSYAKVIILRAFWRELSYWNQGKRNIFTTYESDIADEDENLEQFISEENLGETVFKNEFRENLNLIIDECFEEDKSEILKMHLIQDIRVSEIASKTHLNYKHVYQIVERGTKRIMLEYSERYLTN